MITDNIIGIAFYRRSSRLLHSTNRMTGEAFPEAFAAATPEDVDLTVRKAKAAWRIFRGMPGAARAAFLEAIAEGIEHLGETLVHRVMAETAYPQARVMVERTRTINQLRMFAGIIRDDLWRELMVDPALPDRTPLPRPELRRALVAIGPVVVFGASNFPLAYATAGGDVVSALAVGCPVIIKAHEAHLGTNALVAGVIRQAAVDLGMPDGVFSSLHGDGFETGKALVLHPDTAAVGFTGSLAGGRALFDLGAGRSRPIPVFAEMGSINPVFLLPGRLQDDSIPLAGQLANSMTMSAGQFCTNPGLLIALRSDLTTSFLGHLVSALDKVEAAKMLTADLGSSFHRGVARVHMIDGVGRLTARDGDGDDIVPVLARVTADVFLQHPGLQHEIFGPYALFVECEDVDQLLELAGCLEGQLTSTVQASPRDKSLVDPLLDVLQEKAGRVIFNGVPTGVEVCDAMTHGGPFPATTDARFTAVGRHALRRWVRPVTLQGWPSEWLPGIFQ